MYGYRIGRDSLGDIQVPDSVYTMGPKLRVGQEFGGYVEQVRKVIRRLKTLEEELGELPLGDHFAAQGGRDAIIQASGTLKAVAVSLMKIANNIRWLGSGPRCGLEELEIPAVQPGSSIMPGKVNPVIAEALAMVGAQVIGNAAAITVGGQSV